MNVEYLKVNQRLLKTPITNKIKKKTYEKYNSKLLTKTKATTMKEMATEDFEIKFEGSKNLQTNKMCN